MKNKLVKLVLLGSAAFVWLCLTAYSVAVWWMLRGVGAYRMETRLGGFLSASWQYTAFVAVLLTIVLGITLVVFLIRWRSRAAGAKLSATQGLQGTFDQATAQPQQGTEKLQPRTGLSVDPADGTVLLGQEAAGYGGGAVWPGGGAAVPNDGTVLLGQEAAGYGGGAVWPGAAAPAGAFCCPRCGAPVGADQMFCTHCGLMLRGG